MTVTVNGEVRTLAPATTVSDLIPSAGAGRPRDATGTAVAVNDEVVPRSRWSSTELSDGDRVELLGAVAGG